MKRSYSQLLIFVVYLLSGCGQEAKFERVPDSEVDSARLIFATEISKKILTAQKEGGFYKLNTDEAIPKMVEVLNETTQKQSYETIKSAFGEYQGLIFEYMMKPKDGSLFEVYRFEGKFNPKAKVEVRTVLDAEGKLAGFFVRPWIE
ncbi:MAG: hypothetical protein ACFHWX_01030 [Bacteroidota bacterium]